MPALLFLYIKMECERWNVYGGICIRLSFFSTQETTVKSVLKAIKLDPKFPDSVDINAASRSFHLDMAVKLQLILLQVNWEMNFEILNLTDMIVNYL